MKPLTVHEAIEWGSLSQVLPDTQNDTTQPTQNPPLPTTTTTAAVTTPNLVPEQPYCDLNSSWFVVPEPSAPPLEVDDFEILNISPPNVSSSSSLEPSKPSTKEKTRIAQPQLQ
jgi:hypothetical protein